MKKNLKVFVNSWSFFFNSSKFIEIFLKKFVDAVSFDLSKKYTEKPRNKIGSPYSFEFYNEVFLYLK